MATKGNRYLKFIVDGKQLRIILMDEVDGEWVLPGKYRKFLNLNGIEMPPASNREAAEYLREKWGIDI